MSWIDQPLPTNAAELYDLLQERFGVGNYDDLTSDQPYWQARMRQIKALKILLGKRRLSVRDVAITALYCHAHGIHVAKTELLVQHRPTALAEWSAAERRRLAERFESDYAAALHDAITSKDFPSADRLLRATDKKQALAHYREGRSLA